MLRKRREEQEDFALDCRGGEHFYCFVQCEGDYGPGVVRVGSYSRCYSVTVAVVRRVAVPGTLRPKTHKCQRMSTKHEVRKR